MFADPVIINYVTDLNKFAKNAAFKKASDFMSLNIFYILMNDLNE